MRDLTIKPEIEVLLTADCPRRRNWSDADKLRIVEESFEGHRQITATARRHGVSRSLLTMWRRDYRNGVLGTSRGGSFAPLTVTEAPASQTTSVERCPPPDCQVEIALPNGRRIIVPLSVAPEALARILAVVGGQ